MKRDIAICLIVAALSLVTAAVFHAFLPGFGAMFKPLMWPLVILPFCVRRRAAVVTAAVVPLLSAAVNGMPSWLMALALAGAATAGVLILAFIRGVAQSGSASALGAEGRGFKSRRPDHIA